ncbi:MAG TPA: phage holin family protein [Firmicutes bacterium]|nr:phage holin family protein [Bacillota bacterium]
MDFLKAVKAVCITVFGLLSSWLGVLAVPVYVLVGCNVMDYATGLAAAHRRGQKVSSYIGVLGIAKKVCMWLLIAVGAVVDWLLLYAGDQLGVDIHLPMLVASLTAVWLIVNEVISILENIGDTGVPLPGFLTKIVEGLKSKIESAEE